MRIRRQQQSQQQQQQQEQQEQRMESLNGTMVTVLPATLLQERDSKSLCSGIRSRGSSNWLDKLRAAKGLAPEPKAEIAEIDELARSLHGNGNSSGESKSSGGVVVDCIAADKVVSSAGDKVGFVAGECKEEVAERDAIPAIPAGAEAELVQCEQCDSFDPKKATSSSGGGSGGLCNTTNKVSNSSEGLSQVCPSEGSSQENRKGKSLSPGISNADNAANNTDANANTDADATPAIIKACGAAAADHDVYAFGLPREDFEPSQGCVTTVAAPEKTEHDEQQQQRGQPQRPRRKRKQQCPKSCPRGDELAAPPGQEVTGPLLQRRNLELLRLGRHYYSAQGEKGSPESAKANPACRTQLALRDEYLTATRVEFNCSDEGKRSCASLTTSCMEKMRAFSLRSQSSTESDGNSSDSASDAALTLRRRRRSKDLQGAAPAPAPAPAPAAAPAAAAGVCLSKRRKLYAGGASVTPFQVEGTLPSLQREDQLQARRRTPQANGFFDIASSMVRAPPGAASKLDTPDHPASHPKDTLFSSVYQVFAKAGKNGLTAREAVSKIAEEKLPGLGECSVAARVEVGKIVRTSPYFMELEESRFVLCSAITGIEDKASTKGPAAEKVKEQVYELQNWAALAVRRARTGKTRRKPIRDRSVAVPGVGKPGSEENSSKGASLQQQRQQQQQQQQQQQSEQEPPRKRRLKSVQQDSTGLGNRCNRSDGKGWHCPLLAQVGYLLCDHHLDRLRAKSGSKARRPNKNRVERRTNGANNNNNANSGGGGGGNKTDAANSNRSKNSKVDATSGRGKQGKAGHGHGHGHGQGQGHRSGSKAPPPPPPPATNPAAADSWGIRQTLSVARLGRGSEKRQKRKAAGVAAEEEQEEKGEESGEEVMTFGLRF